MFEFLKKHPSSPTPLFFHNTLSGKKEEFLPLEKGAAKLYSCGPTVYGRAHIGNFRSALLSDLLRRTLKWNGYSVMQVVNITDIGHLSSDGDTGEDKMTRGLMREGKEITLPNMLALGESYANAYVADLQKLHVLLPHHMPKASAHLEEQIALIKILEEKGFAYQTQGGVYFNTSLFSRYGNLGNVNLTGQEAGARVEENSEKKNPRDFALWKKDASLGWESPWGKGFPGWHIECSAMSMKYLGETFDIHTGGIDHIPVHHNNEIAQSEAATDKPFVRYWLHNAFISISDEKISKSLQNDIILDEVETRGFSPLSYRYWLLTGHYRSPMNFTWEALEGAQNALVKLHRYFDTELDARGGTASEAYRTRFTEAINDDLDTPRTVALLWEALRDDSLSREDKRATLLSFDEVLGLMLGKSSLDPILSNKEKVLESDEIPDAVRSLLKEREEAREKKDWDTADRLRASIAELGFEIKDSEDGARIYRK